MQFRHDTSARLVERLLPAASYRQWVLTVPLPLRLRIARDPGKLSHVLNLFHRALRAELRRLGLPVSDPNFARLRGHPRFERLLITGPFPGWLATSPDAHAQGLRDACCRLRLAEPAADQQGSPRGT